MSWRSSRNLDGNLARMATQIADGIIDVDRFTRFEIRDPKPRRILAPSLSERVLRHALMVLAARLDRDLIEHTYARRVGHGTHAAVAQAQQHSRR